MATQTPLQTRFTVADMSCGHCVKTIREAFEEQMPGTAVEIKLDDHIVAVGGDAATAEAVIREAGYTPIRL